MKATNGRNRMIVILPVEVQMAIRLISVKQNTTTGEVIADLIRLTYPADVK
jgi:hypothetical protein